MTHTKEIQLYFNDLDIINAALCWYESPDEKSADIKRITQEKISEAFSPLYSITNKSKNVTWKIVVEYEHVGENR